MNDFIDIQNIVNAFLYDFEDDEVRQCGDCGGYPIGCTVPKWAYECHGICTCSKCGHCEIIVYETDILIFGKDGEPYHMDCIEKHNT